MFYPGSLHQRPGERTEATLWGFYSHALQKSSNSVQIKRAMDLLSGSVRHSETQSMASSLGQASEGTLGSVWVGKRSGKGPHVCPCYPPGIHTKELSSRFWIPLDRS